MRGLDSLAFALVRATTYGHHQSRDEQEVVNIDHIRLRLVLTFYIAVRRPLGSLIKDIPCCMFTCLPLAKVITFCNN